MKAAFAPPSPAFKAALLISAVVLFAVSGGMLWHVGYNYDGLQGSPLTKIHPFTYALFALLLWRALQSGAPIGFLHARLRQRPGAALLLAAAALLIVDTMLRGASGLAGFVDTFAGPAALVLLLYDFDAADLSPLSTMLHLMMTINGALGLVEFATHTLIFPYRLDGVAHLEDARSTALQGHPLLNASLTGVYVIALLSGARALNPALRAGQFLLQMAALAVFGGRTAILIVLAMLPFFAVYALFGSLKRGRVSLAVAAFACAALPLAALVVIAALASGIADLLLYRFVDDNGSAQTRIVMFEMLKPFSLGTLLVGPDLEQVESLRRHYGLELGVENPFIRMILYQGGLVMAAVFAALALFFRELLKGRGAGVIAPAIAMAVLLNSSESIASKTNILDKFVLIFVCLFPRARAAAREAPEAAPGGLRALAPRTPDRRGFATSRAT